MARKRHTSIAPSSGRKPKRPLVKRIVRWIGWSVVIWVAASLAGVLFYKWVPVYYTPLMIIRGFEQKADGREWTIHHQWVSLRYINPALQQAVVASEDNLFAEHNGFDVKQMEIALRESREQGKPLRGASTITQQTARNVFLWQGGGWLRKGMEAWFTVLIELMWSKQRIMEVYLNSIEMGDGIYGAEAVAQMNFGKSARNLSRSECALVAATLPDPLHRDSANPTPQLLRRRQHVLKMMRLIGPVDFTK